MTATDILKAADNHISGRAQTYDSPGGERSAPRAAAIFNAWTGRDLTPADIIRVLIAVKMTRQNQSPRHQDTIEDLPAYFALLGEECLENARESIREAIEEARPIMEEAMEKAIASQYCVTEPVAGENDQTVKRAINVILEAEQKRNEPKSWQCQFCKASQYMSKPKYRVRRNQEDPWIEPACSFCASLESLFSEGPFHTTP